MERVGPDDRRAGDHRHPGRRDHLRRRLPPRLPRQPALQLEQPDRGRQPGQRAALHCQAGRHRDTRIHHLITADHPTRHTVSTVNMNERATTTDVRWYVVHAYSGHEEKVKANLLKRVESMDMHDKIFDVLVPTEEVMEIKDGQRRKVAKRIFPGY